LLFNFQQNVHAVLSAKLEHMRYYPLLCIYQQLMHSVYGFVKADRCCAGLIILLKV
jgi:hypothetical protein